MSKSETVYMTIFNNYQIKILLLIINLFVVVNGVYSQGNKIISPVIIDTDGAIDDLRMISMFLSIKEVNILAITTSDGMLSPENCEKKVNQLVCHCNRKNILISAGKKSNTSPPVHRLQCSRLPWGDSINENLYFHAGASELIADELIHANEPVVIFCSGPLTNLYDAIRKYPEIKNHIGKVVWYSQGIKPLRGFNYDRDKKAAGYVLNSGLDIVILSNLDKKDACIDLPLLQSIEKIVTPCTKQIIRSHNIQYFHNKLIKNDLYIYDDLLSVYYLYPELFDIKINIQNPNIHYLVDYNPSTIKEKMIKILSGKYVINKNIVFENFPLAPELYRSDIRECMDSIIKKHGELEWQLCVLTNEFHGHLGIYSIVGAKMGLKAMELLHAKRCEMKVESFAGNINPLACLNDGLQASTGATFGHAAISLVNDSLFSPAAIFIYKNKKIKLELKDKYKRQIKENINDGILKYGLLTRGYWKLIRKLGIKYWLEWSRNDIFKVTKL